MKIINIGSLSNEVYNSPVLEKKNMNEGYAVQIHCSSSSSPDISIYESLGNDEGLEPSTNDLRFWVEVTTSPGVADSTSAFVINREEFRGKYIFAKIDVSGGNSIDDTYLIFNQS